MEAASKHPPTTRQECEAAGRYDEAELARRRILHVRKTQEKRVAKELKSAGAGLPESRHARSWLDRFAIITLFSAGL